MSGQKSPNVWSVGDSALTAVWDAKAREYRESEVRVNAIKGNFVEVEIRGARHLRPMSCFAVDENEVYENCGICHGTGVVASYDLLDRENRYPCVNCDGSGLVPHDCDE